MSDIEYRNDGLYVNSALELQGVRQETIDNPEFIQVTTDSEGKVIEATRKDGKKVFPGGIEGSVDETDFADLKEYVDEKDALLQEEINDISSKIITDKTWVTIGDSITWLDGNKQGVPTRPDHGYQWYLQKRIQFGNYTNQGVSGKTMMNYPYEGIQAGDIYTVALGVNDWSNTELSPVGTFSDYKAYKVATGSGEYATVTNFAEALARIIIRINRVAASNNINPYIILMTPRRANKYFGSGSIYHMPDTSVEPNNGGIYLHEYADIIKEVAAYEGFPVVDLYYESGVTDANLPSLCYDITLHPNDNGMQLIANMIYPQMEKILR